MGGQESAKQLRPTASVQYGRRSGVRHYLKRGVSAASLLSRVRVPDSRASPTRITTFSAMMLHRMGWPFPTSQVGHTAVACAEQARAE